MPIMRLRNASSVMSVASMSRSWGAATRARSCVARSCIVATIPAQGGASMRKVRVAPKGMGINDFVAEAEGFFAAEGIEVEWDLKTFRGTQSKWVENKYLQRPQDKPY